jgi:hypothetical protein
MITISFCSSHRVSQSEPTSSQAADGCVVVFIDVADVGANAVQTYDPTHSDRKIRPSAKRGKCTVAPRDPAYPIGLWFASSFPRFVDLIAGLG